MLTRDVADFEEAVKYIQLLQANKQLLDSEAINVIKTSSNQKGSEIEQLKREFQLLQVQGENLKKQLERKNHEEIYFPQTNTHDFNNYRPVYNRNP